MSVPGLINPPVVLLPFKGRPMFGLSFDDSTGADVDLTARTVSVSVYTSLDATSPLATRDTGGGGGVSKVTPITGGNVTVELTAPQLALLSLQRLYAFVATVTDDVSAQIVATIAGFLLPTAYLPGSGFAITSGTGISALSTSYVNTVTITGYTGGAGTLEALDAAGQNVPCVVQFPNWSTGAPEQWVLETSSATPVANEIVASLANAGKRWRRIM